MDETNHLNEANGLNEVMFTSAAVLDLLLQIDELKEYTVGMAETLDGNIQLQIGNSTYIIDSTESKIITVDDNIVGEIELTTEDAYEDIVESVGYDKVETEKSTTVSAGLIKEIAKSLALGGLIRFASKHLLK